MITQNELKQLVNYNPHTGIFTCKKSGKTKGSWTSLKYSRIQINNKRYYSHKLAWLYVYGEWPNIIDHIDGNPANNNIDNLRISTFRLNMQNTKKHRNGKLVGCYYKKTRKRWYSLITINNKQHFIGSYKTELEAHEAYKAMEWLINEMSNING